MIPVRAEPIRGRRVTLRPLGPDDLPAKARWSMDRGLVGLMSGHPEFARATFDEALAETRRWWDLRARETTSEQWAILGPDGSLIGSLDLHDLRPSPGPGQRAGLVPEIGQAEHRGQGLGTEAMELAVKRVFEDLGQVGLEVEVLAGNHRARRAFEKIGFTERGRRREEDGGTGGAGQSDVIEWVVMVLDRQGAGPPGCA